MSETQAPLRVAIVDDHPIVRTGLRLMLNMRKDFLLVGEAGDGATAIRLVGETQPDVVLMDIRMPSMDGLEAIAQIRQQWPQVAILILTTYNEDELMLRALKAGARGYVLKDTDVHVLLQAIQTVAQGSVLVQPEVMERLLSHTEPSSSHVTERPELTEREQEILEGVVRGERSKEIARRLGLSERTIWAYLTTIYNKLGVDSRASAVAVALKYGLIKQE